MKQTGFWILFIIVIIGFGYLVFVRAPQLPEEQENINSFEECAAAGYPVGESYPRQCWMPDGGHFVEEIDEPIIPPVSSRDPGAYDGCIITGCSGQVCAREEVATTCEYQEKFACYAETGICEEQLNGECGWTQTNLFVECLENIVPQAQ